MSSYVRESREGQIYVGNLPPDINTRELENLFYKFGKITSVNLKERNGPPFAFVEFDDPRDADDAIEQLDGYNFEGYSLRVERPRGSSGRGGPPRGGLGYGGGNGGYRGGAGARPRGPPPGARRSDYKVRVSGLPMSGSWQDLKDHMREAGDICYADVFNDGTGVVEFLRHDDMKYAAKKLDDTRFKSHEGESSYIRVKEDYSRGRSRSRSRSRSASSRRRSRRSPSDSPADH